MVLITFFFLITAFVFCRVSVSTYHKLWNPLFLLYFMLALGVLSSLLGIDELVVSDKELTNGILWITIGGFLFSVSFLIGQFLLGYCNKKGLLASERKRRVTSYKQETLSKLTTFAIIIASIQLLVAFKVVIDLAGGDFSRLIVDNTSLRQEYLHREEDISSLFSLFSIFLTLNFYCLFCLFPEAIKQKCPRALLKLIIVLIIRMAGSIITMSKEAFILDCIILISAYSAYLPDMKTEFRFFKKYVIYIVGLVITLILVTSIQRNYAAVRYNNYFEAVFGTIYSYIGMPVSAFCLLIARPSIFTLGDQCFRPVINVLSRFGITERLTLFQESIQGDVNVYSMFGNMYNDFSFAGIIFVSLVFGLFLGLVYRNDGSHRVGRIVVNSMVLMTLFFGYYDFKLMQTIYLFTILYAALFDRVFAKYLYRVDNCNDVYYDSRA